VLAIRTKEFALGMIALLVVMSIVAERQRVKAAARQLLPYFIVFLIYLGAYARLYMATKVDGAYAMSMSPISILSTLWYYFAQSLYRDQLGAEALEGIVFALAIGAGFAWKEGWRRIVFGLLGFIILLGPTLLISAHLDTLYLYAPHFLLALAIGGLIGNSRIATVLAVVVAAVLVIYPLKSALRSNVINYVFTTGAQNKAQVDSAKQLLSPLQHDTTIFISGVKAWANPFSFKEGHSIRTIFLDDTIIVKTDKPEADLVQEFCKTAGLRKFLRFDGSRGEDVTAEIAAGCPK
jgi:hypothetical protein